MKGTFRTKLALTVLRIVLGIVFITHGWPKLIGGVAGTGEFLAQMGIPLAGLVAWGLTLLEVGGGALLALGIATRPIALLLAVHMLAGLFLVHAPQGWYVVGPGQGGAEFNLVLLTALLTITVAVRGYGLGRGREKD